MGNKAVLIAFMAIPALCTWALMRFLHDAVLTLLSLIVLYLLLIFVYHTFIDEISFMTVLGKELLKKSENISLGLKLMGAGVGIGLIGILYCMFSPIGPEKFVFAAPYNPSEAKRIMYNVAFGILFLLRAPIEHNFYNWVIYSEFNEKGGLAGMAGGLTGEEMHIVPALLISFFNALMQFAAFYYMIHGIIPAIVVSLIGFGIHYGLLHVKVNNGVIASTLFSVGIALGILLIYVYLEFTVKGKVGRKTPEFYFPADMRNCWMKWMKTAPPQDGKPGEGPESSATGTTAPESTGETPPP